MNDGGTNKTVSSALEEEASGSEISCYICHGGGATEDILHTGCACRGTEKKHAHVSCLVEWAKARFGNGKTCSYRYQEAWAECRECKQRYNGLAALQLAKKAHELHGHTGCRWQVSSLIILGESLMDAEQYSEAAIHFERCIGLCDQKLESASSSTGIIHDNKAVALIHLWQCYDRQGKSSDKLHLLDEALELVIKLHGDDLLVANTVRRNVAEHHMNKGEWDDAIGILQKALDSAKAHDENGIRPLDIMHQLARALCISGNATGAASMINEACEKSSRLLGDSHPLAIIYAETREEILAEVESAEVASSRSNTCALGSEN